MENTVGIQVSAQDQVAEALKLVNRVIKSEDKRNIENCYTLILKAYDTNWSKKQAKHFDSFYMALKTFKDYFLSFTSRNPDEPNDNIINDRYKYLIKHIIGNDKYKTEIKGRKNLLAEAINRLLKSELLEGFFYPEREGDNTYVDLKLKEAVANCFVFIQIVQNVMFRKIEDNYCHLEYEQAKNILPKDECMKFVLAEKSHNDLIDEYEVPIDYDAWYSEIYRRDKIILDFTEQYNLNQILSIKEILQDKLVEAVRQIKKEVIEEVPAN